MEVFKCKMCGGSLILDRGARTAECEYCGTLQTIPEADNERKMTLFNRANRYRLDNEFDKASGIYESIVSEFTMEAEAYWGLILCKYGIEYVDDPKTGRKIPTCHRSSYKCIMDDEDYKSVMKYAHEEARVVYERETKEIERLRKGILEVSSREAPYDIFICYKETENNGQRTLDSVLSQDIYDALRGRGYRVFFSRVTLEDKLGREYEPYIFAALQSARIMLVVGTDYEHYNGVWVKNEWSRFLQLIASGKNKYLIPCYKDMDPNDMPKEFRRLQAQDMGKVGAIQDLLRGIDKILDTSKTVGTGTTGGTAANIETLLRRGNMAVEDGQWNKAEKIFDEILNVNAECAEAYLGQAKCEKRVSSTRDLVFYSQPPGKLLLRVKQFADDKLLREIQGYENEYKEIIDKQRAASRAEREAIDKDRADAEKGWIEDAEKNWEKKKKKKKTAILLCVFLGFLGMHKFYERKYLLGYLYATTFGFFLVGVFVDLVYYAKQKGPYYLPRTSEAVQHIISSNGGSGFLFSLMSSENVDIKKQRENGPRLIQYVVAKGSAAEIKGWPQGERSHVFDSQKVGVIYFLVHLDPTFMSTRTAVKVGIRIWNNDNAVVFENVWNINVQSGNDRVSCGWIIKGKYGNTVPSGWYRGEIWAENSCVYEYPFKIESPKT